MYVRHYPEAVELTVGLLVCLLFGLLLYGAIEPANSPNNREGAFPLFADFTHIDGLQRGADVKLAGIKVGSVDTQTLDPKNYKARVGFHIRPDIQLSKDTAAIITSDSLMSDKYLSLFPGADDNMLRPGEKITQTQGSIGIEQLLSKFLMSMTQTLTQLQKNEGHKGAKK